MKHKHLLLFSSLLVLGSLKTEDMTVKASEQTATEATDQATIQTPTPELENSPQSATTATPNPDVAPSDSSVADEDQTLSSKDETVETSGSADANQVAKPVTDEQATPSEPAPTPEPEEVAETAVVTETVSPQQPSSGQGTETVPTEATASPSENEATPSATDTDTPVTPPQNEETLSSETETKSGHIRIEPVRPISEVENQTPIPYKIRVDNMGEAQKLIAESPEVTEVLIGEDNNQAILRKDEQGFTKNLDLKGWSLYFDNNIPVTAFYKETDDDISSATTKAIETALHYNTERDGKTLKTSDKWIGVDLPSNKTFNSNQTIKLLKGVAYLNGNGSTLNADATEITKDGTQAVISFETGSYDASIKNFNINMLNTDKLRAIKAEGTRNTQIENNTIQNANYNAILVSAADRGTSDVKIINNSIQATPGEKGYDKPFNAIDIAGAPVDVMTKGKYDPEKVAVLTTDPYLKQLYRKAVTDANQSNTSIFWHLYVKGAGKVLDPHSSKTAKNITVSGNHISGGRYGISLSYVSDSQIRGNSVTKNARNISVQNHNYRNKIENNFLTEALSTGILLGYKSSQNTVHANRISSSQFSGQAPIVVDQGSNHNTISENYIESGGTGSNWLLYAGSDVSGTQFINNVASGKVNKSAVGIEAIWDYHTSGKDIASYTTTSDGKVVSDVRFGQLHYNGGNGNTDQVTVRGNLIAPEVTSKKVPVAYFSASSSKGWNQSSYSQRNITGHLTNLTSDNNLVVGQKDQDYHQLIREHENGAQVNGSATVGGFKEEGVSTIRNQVVYTTVNYNLKPSEEQVTLLATGDHIQLGGNNLNNTLKGNLGSDTINALSGDDILDGGYGNDLLTGGEGADRYTLTSQLHKTDNVDTISDFNSNQGDKLYLASEIFGNLDGNWLATSRSAINEQSRILYENGNLYFLEGTSSNLSETHFAILTGQPHLNQADFIAQ